MRLATLVGRTESGKWECIDVAEGDSLSALLKHREAIREACGIVKRGKGEIKLTELRVLSNNTAGGELKAACRFK